DDDTTEQLYLRAGGQLFGHAFYAETALPSASAGKIHIFMPRSDHLGSTAAVIDHDTGEVVEAATYQPYGNVESDYRPWVQVDFVACRGQTAAGGHRLLEQREGREADFVHVSSPSSPQRAPAFFLRTRRAAVSARAASLRFSSRSRSLIRFCSSLRGFFDMVSPATAA